MTGSNERDPSERDPNARDRILQAASELFYRDGIGASGVDALVERANVAKATFYRHFASKDDLILAWLRGPEARWLDSVLPEVERRTASPLERLVAFWDVLGDWLEQRGFLGCPYLNTLVEIKDPDAPARREVRSFVAEVEDVFRRTAEAAGLPDAAEFARRMRFNAMAMFMAIRLERSREPVETARASAVALLAVWTETTPRQVEELVSRASDEDRTSAPED
jgi:AcrR family transcriptional regulator